MLQTTFFFNLQGEYRRTSDCKCPFYENMILQEPNEIDNVEFLSERSTGWLFDYADICSSFISISDYVFCNKCFPLPACVVHSTLVSLSHSCTVV